MWELIKCCRITLYFGDSRSSCTDLSSGDWAVCPSATGLYEKGSGGVSRTGVNRGCRGDIEYLLSFAYKSNCLALQDLHEVKHFKHI